MKQAKHWFVVPLLTVILWSSAGYAQSNRVVGVLAFQNKGDIVHNWVGRGIEALLTDKLATVSGVHVYEKETFLRKLKEVKISPRDRMTAKTAFSIGKATGVQVLFGGDYQVTGGQLIVNFKMMSTYTGSAIYEETFTGTLEDIFSFFSKGVKKGLDIMVVVRSPEEDEYLDSQPTNSMKAFESYCKAFVEIDRESPMEVVAGYLERALREDPGFEEARYILGVVYYNGKLYSKSLQQFNAVITRNPDYFRAYYGRGVIYYLEKEYYKALGEFRHSLRLNSEHDRSYYYLGITYTKIDSLKKGIQQLERSIEINPNYSPAYYQLGIADMKRGWYKKAITSLIEANKLNSDYSQSHNALGEAYYALNQFEEAIIEFKKAIQLKPKYATAHFNLANSIYRRGALAEIVDAFWSLLEVQYPADALTGTNGSADSTYGTNGNYPSPLQGLESLREKSRIQDASKLYKEMIHSYRVALKYDNRFYEASYNIALTYENLGVVDSAEYFYKKAIGQNFNLPQAHMRLGKIYEGKQLYRDALKSFKNVVKIEPFYFASNPVLGEEYRYINIMEVVLKEQVEILESDPQNQEVLKTIGKIYHSLGRLSQAEEYFQKLLALRPNDTYAQQSLREVRRKLRKL